MIAACFLAAFGLLSSFGQTLAATTTLLIPASSSDANQDGSGNGASNVSLNSSELWLGTGKTTAYSYTGFRFANVPIPQGATIESARLNVYSTSGQYVPMSFRWYGELVPNSAPFNTSTAKPSLRTVTASSILHTSNMFWAQNTWYQLDQIAPVVQPIISQASWNPGNSLTVIAKGAGSAWGRKFFASFDRNSALAPTLQITYSTVDPSPTPSPSPTPTPTPTPLPSPTPSPEPTPTPIPSPSPTPTPTPLPTPTPTPSPTPTSDVFTDLSVGQGGSDVTPHQLVRASNDRVYMAANQQYTGLLRMHVSDGTGLPTQGSTFTQIAMVTDSANLIMVDAVYDGGQFIHLLTNTQAGKIKDYPFDITTNSFKAPIELAANGHTVVGGYVGSAGITGMFDGFGQLHLAYWTNGNDIAYQSYTYDAVPNTLTPVPGTLTTVNDVRPANHPQLAVSPVNDSVTLAWVSENTVPRIMVRTKGPAGWGEISPVSTNPVWVSTNAGINIDQGPSMVFDSQGALHLVYMENYDSTGNYGRVHYVSNSTGSYVDFETDFYTHDPAIAITNANQLFIVGHGHGLNAACLSELDMCVVKNVAGVWQNPALFKQHIGSDNFDTSPSIKWSRVGWNRPEVIEFLFSNVPGGDYDHPQLIYARVESAGMPTPTPSPTPTPIPTPTPAPTPSPSPDPTPSPTPTPDPTPTPIPSPTPSPSTITAVYAVPSDDRDALSLTEGSGMNVKVSGYNATEKTMFVSNDSENETAGMQFQLDIPANAIIQSASIQVQAGGSQSTTSTGSLAINRYEAGTLPAFSDGPFGDLINFNSLALSPTVYWQPGTAWSLGSMHATPDLSGLVQSFIQRADYQPSSFIGFVVSEGTVPYGKYYGWNDYSAGTAPATLTVTYTLP